MIDHCSIWGEQRCRGWEIATMTPILLSFLCLLSLQYNFAFLFTKQAGFISLPLDTEFGDVTSFGLQHEAKGQCASLDLD